MWISSIRSYLGMHKHWMWRMTVGSLYQPVVKSQGRVQGHVPPFHQQAVGISTQLQNECFAAKAQGLWTGAAKAQGLWTGSSKSAWWAWALMSSHTSHCKLRPSSEMPCCSPQGKLWHSRESVWLLCNGERLMLKMWESANFHHQRITNGKILPQTINYVSTV